MCHVSWYCPQRLTIHTWWDTTDCQNGRQQCELLVDNLKRGKGEPQVGRLAEGRKETPMTLLLLLLDVAVNEKSESAINNLNGTEGLTPDTH